MNKHKCDGCKYKGEHQEMMFKPFGVCLKETDLIKAEQSYNADKCPYEKQHSFGEWISVTERLPETDARVLVYMHENRMSYTRIDTDRVVQGKWVRWETCVTHWMPLPEPPETEKGGE